MLNRRYTEPWPRRLFLKRISLSVIVITAVLSITVAALSIYGNNVGNFVVSIEQETRSSLSLSESGDFDADATTVLQAGGLKNATHATYANIPENDAFSQGGSANDSENRYIAYTFFLKNTSPIAEMYTMEIVINEQYLNVAAAMRVMVITNGERTIYAQRDTEGNVVSHPDITKPYTTEPFPSVDKVCSVTNDYIASGEIVKYTVVVWLEGYDPECIDNIKGGAIRMSMNFKVVGSQ